MQSTNSKRIGAGLWIALMTALAGAAFGGPPPDRPRPLPKDIVTAWKDAGARVVWFRVTEFGYLDHYDEKQEKAGDLAGFNLYYFRWKKGLIAKLPAPETPFGLDFGGTSLLDPAPQLAELASLKNLHSLSLNNT